MNRVFLYVALMSSFSTSVHLMNGSSIATLEVQALEEQEAQADICSTCRESLGPVLEVLVKEHNQYIKLSPEVLKATPEERKASLLRLSADPAMPEAQKRLIQGAILQEQELFNKVTVKYTAAQTRLKKIKEQLLSAEFLEGVQDGFTKEITKARQQLNSPGITDEEKVPLKDDIARWESIKSDIMKFSALLTSIRSASEQEDITGALEHEMLKLPSVEARYNKTIDSMLEIELLREAKETHLHCAHRFHKDCLDSHFKSQSITLPSVSMQCPTCRADLDESDLHSISIELTLDDYIGFINNKLCDLLPMTNRTYLTRFLADPLLVGELETMLGLSRAEVEQIISKLKELLASLTVEKLREKGFHGLIQEKFPSYSKEHVAYDINRLVKTIVALLNILTFLDDELLSDTEAGPVLKSLMLLLLQVPEPQLRADSPALFQSIVNSDALIRCGVNLALPFVVDGINAFLSMPVRRSRAAIVTLQIIHFLECQARQDNQIFVERLHRSLYPIRLNEGSAAIVADLLLSQATGDTLHEALRNLINHNPALRSQIRSAAALHIEHQEQTHAQIRRRFCMCNHQIKFFLGASLYTFIVIVATHFLRDYMEQAHALRTTTQNVPFL